MSQSETCLSFTSILSNKEKTQISSRSRPSGHRGQYGDHYNMVWGYFENRISGNTHWIRLTRDDNPKYVLWNWLFNWGTETAEKKVVNQHIKRLDAHEQQVTDLQDCSRCNNLPIGFLKWSLLIWILSLEIEVEHAHRVYTSTSTDHQTVSVSFQTATLHRQESDSKWS